MAAATPRRPSDGRAAVVAGGLSLGLHGVALAGLLALPGGSPPRPLTVIGVDIVFAAGPDGAATGGTPSAAPAGDPGPAGPAASAETVPPDEPPAAAISAAHPALPPPPRKPAPPAPDPPVAETPPDRPGAAPPDETADAGATEPAAVAAPAPTPGAEEIHRLAARPTAAGGGKAGTAPAYRGGGLSNRPPRYPWRSRRRGHEGRVVLRVHVTAAGEAGTVRIHRSSGHRLLDAAALDAVKSWRFRPATRAGQRIAGIVDVPVAFKLEN